MSGAIAQRANGTTKALGGKVSFFYALVSVFFGGSTRDPVPLDDARREARMHDVIVANGR